MPTVGSKPALPVAQKGDGDVHFAAVAGRGGLPADGDLARQGVVDENVVAGAVRAEVGPQRRDANVGGEFLGRVRPVRG